MEGHEALRLSQYNLLKTQSYFIQDIGSVSLLECV